MCSAVLNNHTIGEGLEQQGNRMDSKFARAVLSFCLVAAAYYAYLNVAEPLMAAPHPSPPIAPGGTTVPGGAPTAPQLAPDGLSASDRPNAMTPLQRPDPTKRFKKLIAPHFPADSWERTQARIIKNDQFMLLWREFRTTEDGRLRVFPCTIVFHPDGLQASSALAPDGRTWIVQAPEGALLSFDEPIDDRLMKAGNLKAAFVQGEVTIRGSESEAGAGDQVELTTSNVQLSEQRIWTPNEVHFRVGPHFGSGRDLSISMTGIARGEIKRLPATIPARVQSVELAHLEKLQISLPEERSSVGPDGRTVKRIVHIPISIACQGYMLMDMSRGVAQMQQNVRIARPRLDDTGLEDHLACDQLSVYFQRNVSRPGDEQEAPPFELERAVARGKPAMAYSVQQGADPSPAVYSLEAPKFEVGLGKRQEFIADGAGRIRGRFGENGQGIDLTWQGNLTWKQDEDRARLRIQQQAYCSMEQLGELSSEQMEVCLQRTAGSGSGGLRPVSANATGRVRAEVRQIKAQVDQFQVAFRDEKLPPAAGNALSLGSPQRTPADAAQRRFIVSGGELRLGVIRDGDQTRIDDLTLDTNVRCLEVARNNEGRGAELNGDRFELHRIASGAAVGSVTGTPVKIQAQRMDVRGAVVRFEQGSNRLWIDGAGSAAMPLPPAIAERFTGRAAVGFINWQQSCSFDGREVRADGEVELRGPSQLMRCASVVGELSQPIRFGDARASQQLELEGVTLNSIAAEGGVFVENRTFDQQGLVSIETGSMRRLRISDNNTRIVGSGPGWVKTVRKGQAFAPGLAAGIGPARPPAANANDQLTCLRVNFERQLNGDLGNRSLFFEDRVQATYGQVPDWDTKLKARSRQVPVGQLLVTCNRLSVVQLFRRGLQQAPFELNAEGNTVVEGNDFIAEAAQLRYSQEKDRITLDGGAGDAHILRTEPGKSRQETSARKIQYWIKDQRIQVDGANSIELSGG